MLLRSLSLAATARETSPDVALLFGESVCRMAVSEMNVLRRLQPRFLRQVLHVKVSFLRLKKASENRNTTASSATFHPALLALRKRLPLSEADKTGFNGGTMV